MDALQCMGAVRMRVQTADKNTTIIHTNPVNVLTSCEAKSCMFVRNKKIYFCLQLKQSIITLPPVKSPSPVDSYIKIHPYICLELFLLVNSAWSVHISLLIQRRLFHQRKHHYEYRTRILAGSKQFEVNDGFFFFFTNMQLFASQEMDWSGVDYLWIIVMFLSAVWTLILTAPIHCRGFTGEQVM